MTCPRQQAAEMHVGGDLRGALALKVDGPSTTSTLPFLYASS